MTIAGSSRDGLQQTGVAPIRIWPGTGVASIVAGPAWVAKDPGGRMSFEDYMSCTSTYGYAMNTVDTIAFLAMVPVLLGIFAAYRRSTTSWLGVTAPISAAGFAMAGITNLMEHCSVGSVSLPVPLFTGVAENSPYVLGLMLALLILPFTLALTRVSIIPKWFDWLLALGTLSFWLANNQGGMAVFGVSWIVVGLYLLTHRASAYTNTNGTPQSEVIDAG